MIKNQLWCWSGNERGNYQGILTQDWTEQLFRPTSMAFAGKHLRSRDAIEEMP